MARQPYMVATLTRGTASLSYTYTGREQLPKGSIVAISFRNVLELGIVLGIDDSPPDSSKLLPIIELRQRNKSPGNLILKLAELSASGVHEVVGHLLFDSVTSSLRMTLSIEDEQGLSADERVRIGKLCGKIGKARARTLIRENGWKRLGGTGWSGMYCAES